MARADLQSLSEKINAAIAAGRLAADAEPNDGGSANLDHVVLYGLKGVREDSLHRAGITCWKHGVGTFHLAAPFAGQGQRRYAGVQAMAASLKAQGVDCYVHYQAD